MLKFLEGAGIMTIVKLTDKLEFEYYDFMSDYRSP